MMNELPIDPDTYFTLADCLRELRDALPHPDPLLEQIDDLLEALDARYPDASFRE